MSMRDWSRGKKIAAVILSVATIAGVVTIKAREQITLSKTRVSSLCLRHEFSRVRSFSQESDLLPRVPAVKHILSFGFWETEASMGPSAVFGPVDLEGVIQQATWHPSRFIWGVPGMSGSLGQNRTIPAHYKLQFQELEVSDWAEFSRLGRVMVHHPQDDGFLAAGIRIRIYGLTMSGDEGGDYICYDRAEILDSSLE